MPRFSLSLMVEKSHGSFSKRMSPSKVLWAYTPERTFMRVDFPAPFSPQMACTSPRFTSRVTSWRAFTPGKVLVIPRI